MFLPIRCVHLTVLFAAVAVTVRGATAQPRAPHAVVAPASTTVDDRSERELQRVVDEALAEAVARYGRVTTPEVAAPLDTVIQRLTVAPGAPRRALRWVVVGDSSVNAAALPTGAMRINRGLVDFCRATIADRPEIADADRHNRFLGCLAVVVGHELGHIALGHPDSSVAERLRRGPRLAVAAVGTGAYETALRSALRDSAGLATLSAGRARELAADRYGALLLLRAGWRVEDAIDLFRRLDVDERPGSASSPRELAWFRSHPRAIVRGTELERLRADLRRDQATFDDAVLLVSHAVLLDTAVAMLDRVIADFPDVAAPRHARAAALQLAWMQAVPARRLRVQPIAAAYTSSFAAAVRGAGDDAQRLARARAAYAEALQLERHPYTLANLAVLDAYAGEVSLARVRADEAVQRMPHDTAVLVNAGVVRFLAGDYAAAAVAFAPLAEGPEPVPEAQFNLGRVRLAVGDSVAATRWLSAYLATSTAPEAWAAEAYALVTRSAVGARPVAAVAASAGPPAVGGVALGAAREQVIATLGAPARVQEAGQDMALYFPDRGMVVAINAVRGAVLVVLLTGEAGDVAGVRVGSETADAVRRFGRPTAGSDGTLVFTRRGYVISVRDAAGRVASISVRLNQLGRS